MTQIQPSPKHPIQQHIVQVLQRDPLEVKRFRDLRPADVETNLYSYHLRVLQNQQIIIKHDGGYMLSEHATVSQNPADADTGHDRLRPHIVIMFVVQNSDGDVLLSGPDAAGRWCLPQTNLRGDELDVATAARRLIKRQLGPECRGQVRAGDCYIRLHRNHVVAQSTLAHVYYMETDAVTHNNRYKWARPHKLAQYKLAPAVEAIITRTFFRDPYFFEEYTEDLVQYE